MPRQGSHSGAIRDPGVNPEIKDMLVVGGFTSSSREARQTPECQDVVARTVEPIEDDSATSLRGFHKLVCRNLVGAEGLEPRPAGCKADAELCIRGQIVAERCTTSGRTRLRGCRSRAFATQG